VALFHSGGIMIDGVIYGYYNVVNGKWYIGLTNNERRRRNEHRTNINCTKKSKFYYAVQKYGRENFVYIRIAVRIPDKETLSDLEKYYIKHFDSFNNGYNNTLGGEGGTPKQRPLNMDKETLCILYSEKKLTCQQIGDIYGVSDSTISRYLRDDNITARTKSEINIRRPDELTPELLYTLYITQGSSPESIGKIYHLTRKTISNYLKYDGIATRDKSKSKYKRPKELTKDKLYELYEIKRLSTTDIAELYGIGRSTVSRYLISDDIKTRPFVKYNRPNRLR
jgi:group I intron endonuclease